MSGPIFSILARVCIEIALVARPLRSHALHGYFAIRQRDEALDAPILSGPIALIEFR
jgi:hypothetical protein